MSIYQQCQLEKIIPNCLNSNIFTIAFIPQNLSKKGQIIEISPPYWNSFNSNDKMPIDTWVVSEVYPLSKYKSEFFDHPEWFDCCRCH